LQTAADQRRIDKEIENIKLNFQEEHGDDMPTKEWMSSREK